MPPSALFCQRPQFLRFQAALTAGVALLGAAVGLASAFATGNLSSAHAARDYAASLDLRDAPLAGATVQPDRRAAIVDWIVSAGVPERLPASPSPVAPKIILIFDDIGIDKNAFDEIMKFPGPVTLSFLPYAENVQSLVDQATMRGDDILLHLPMQPTGDADPGPHSLKPGMDANRLFDELAWNLDQFTGYVGANNHMGSKFTQSAQDMKRVLAMLDQKGLFFIDSLTTSRSAASAAGAAVGADVFLRDVFLDAEPGAGAIRRQLALVERIALKTGYAIVICHPRRETLDVVGPWLTTAPARGFELATVSQLNDIRAQKITTAAVAGAQ